MSRFDKIDTNKLNVANVATFCGPVCLKPTGIGTSLVVDTPAVFNGPVSGASINLQDEGSAVTDTPHKTLNFVGTSVTVTDASDDTANIMIMPTGGSDCIRDPGGAPQTEVCANADNTVTMDMEGSRRFILRANGGLEHGTGHLLGGINSLASGRDNQASGDNAQAFGRDTNATAANAHAEGRDTTASAAQAHAEGDGTVASGLNSHAEGRDTLASGDNSHAEGEGTTASGANSHAEGVDSEASGNNSHAEGENTRAIGDNSHAEGQECIATGRNSHAGGYDANARLLNQWSRSSGRFTGTGAVGAQGDAQCNKLIVRNLVLPGGPVPLYLDGQTATQSLTVTQGATWAFCATVSARSYNSDVSSDFAGSWKINGVVDRAASTDLFAIPAVRDETIFLGIPTITAVYSPPALTVEVIVSGNDLVFRATSTDHEWHVVACVDVVEVVTNSVRV